jgi:hypothetical protein
MIRCTFFDNLVSSVSDRDNAQVADAGVIGIGVTCADISNGVRPKRVDDQNSCPYRQRDGVSTVC